MSDGGTFEQLVDTLGGILSPLGQGLSAEHAPALFAGLGFAMTPAQAATLGGATSKLQTGVTSLFELIGDIDQAVTAEHWGQVIENGIAAAVQAGKVIDGFASLGSALGKLPGVTPEMIATLPRRLFDRLLASWCDRVVLLPEVLELTGILEREDHNVRSVDPAKPFYTTNTFHLDRIGRWLSKPGDLLGEIYDWGSPSFNGKKLLSVLDRILAHRGLPVAYDGGGATAKLDVLDVHVGVSTTSPRGLVIKLLDDLARAKHEFTGPDWKLALGLELDVPSGAELTLNPNGVTFKPPDLTKVSGTAAATYSAVRTAAEPFVLLSVAGGSKISIEEVSATLGLEVKANGDAGFLLGADLKRGKALITTEGSDGFLAKLLSGIHVENTFDLGFGYSTQNGLYFHGSSALEIQLASHVDLGPIELDALTLSVGIKDGKFPVGITTDIKADLGPLQAVVQGMGISLDFALAAGNAGNLGPLDLSASFVPPKGVGLSIDAGIVRGGGYLFFDTDRGEYGGALQLDIAQLVSAKAIGVITTKMPDGSKGFALIIIITAEFSPAFQLGYGFTLNGVGGLLGLNRGMDLVALRAGVKTNSIESVLFPKNVVANAPQIISDLRTLFPTQQGTFLIGPMAKLGWGTPTLISLSFGLVLAIPTEGGSPEIALIGILKIALPTDDLDLIKVQINIVGTIDFDKGLLAIDAALFDSHLLFLTLEGSLAIRLKWKDPAGFLVSVGGFHPSYTPPPELECQPMDRLAVNILNTDWARIRVECYFAVTSNSVQTGAKAELYFGFDGFYVDGYLGFDALFQFSPFYFEVGVSAGLSLHVFGIDLLSIRLAFNLSGPSPWHAWGTGSVTILFWDISADFDITWGDRTSTTLPDVDVLPLLTRDLDDPAHWRALPATSTRLWVSVRPVAPDDTALVLHPTGKLSVQQKTAPLDLTWSRFGNQHPADIRRASIKSATSGAATLTRTSINDQFARSQFEDLSDAQKLSVPQFEPMHAGVVLAMGKDAEAGTPVERTIDFETIVIDLEQNPVKPFRMQQILALHRMQLQGTAKKRAPDSRLQQRLRDPFWNPSDKITVQTETYTVASTADNRAHSATSTFSSHAMAADHLATQVGMQPGLAGSLHVIPASEVNRS